MSQVKIQLREPPNVGFLEGFPGIPGAPPDRPPAALRGAVEVRVIGGNPVKAKWVKIELRKIETLLMGQGGPYTEVIGQGPVVWQAQGDYENLQAQDFPFYIRIPENIPPSITLEKGSGIRYEMVATLCTKGKKGLFRRDATPTYTISYPIAIDKHELHTLWPVHRRQATQTNANDSLTLSVTRDAACYGPGDRVLARAELRSARSSPCILRAWECTLREHVTFKPDPSHQPAPGKANGVPVGANAPQYRHNVICDQKVPLSKNIYEGVSQTVELSCVVPASHKTTSCQGRLVEVRFTLSVKAVMESAGSVEVMMPVWMANWPRETSAQMLQRIGPVPHLGAGLLTPNGGQPMPSPPAQAQMRPPFDARSTTTSEHSAISSPISNPPAPAPRRPSPAPPPPPHPDETSPPSPPYTPPGQDSPFAKQQQQQQLGYSNAKPRIGGGGGPVRDRPLTVINADPDCAPAAGEGNGNGRAGYVSAEEEKRRLNEQYAQQQQQQAGGSSQVPREGREAKKSWPTSEDEKRKLYERAQTQARRTQEQARMQQGLAGGGLSREGSISSDRPISTLTTSTSGPIPTITSTLTPPSTASGSTTGSALTKSRSAGWATAEEEKEKLFKQAQRKVRETQGMVQGGRERSASGSGGGGGSVRGRGGGGEGGGGGGGAGGQRPASMFKMVNPDPPVQEEEEAAAAAAVGRTQSAIVERPPPSGRPLHQGHQQSLSVGYGQGPGSGQSNAATAAAAMYAQAMAARAHAAPAPVVEPTPPPAPPPAPASPPATAGPSSSSQQPAQPKKWLSAEDEKAQMARYYAARKAVQQRHGGIAEEGSPSSSAGQQTPPRAASPPYVPPPAPVQQRMASPQIGSGLTPPRAASPQVNINHIVAPAPPAPEYFPPQPSAAPPAAHYSPPARSLSPEVPTTEKERMRLFLEAQDAAARFAQGDTGGGSSSSAPPPPGYGTDAPPAFEGPSSQPLTAAQEKARLREQLQQQQEAAAAAASRPPPAGPSYSPPMGSPPATYYTPLQSPAIPHVMTPPPASAYPVHSPTITQSMTPPPPPAATQSSYYPHARHYSTHAQDAFPAYAPTAPPERAATPPAPPPLMPRPPMEYIRESMISHPYDDDDEVEEQQPSWASSGRSPPHMPLDVRPVSPFSVSLSPQPQGPPYYR